MREILRAEELTKEFVDGVRAVNSVSLQVPARQTLAIIGPNGAGKSTFFGLIAGEPDSNRAEEEGYGAGNRRTGEDPYDRCDARLSCQRNRVGADAEVRRLTEGSHSGPPEQDIYAHREQRVDDARSQ